MATSQRLSRGFLAWHVSHRGEIRQRGAAVTFAMEIRQRDLLVTTIPLSRRLLSAIQFQPSTNDLSRNRPP